MLEIRPIRSLDLEEIQPLVEASLSEGYHFVQRLVTEWQASINRFEKRGEILYGAYNGGRLLGIGGLTAMSDVMGRVRRVSVLPAERGSGIGSVLVQAVIRRAAQSFQELVLYTADAGPFYERLGFEPSGVENPTHRMLLPDRSPGG